MTAWSIFWKAVRAFFGWLFLTILFVFVATFTYGFKAYCPLESFLVGAIIILIAILILGVLTGVFKD